MSLRYRFTFIEVELEELQFQDDKRSSSCPPLSRQTDKAAYNQAMMWQMSQLEVRVQNLRSEGLRAEPVPLDRNPTLQLNAANPTSPIRASDVPNLGSWGHPELCHRPCITFVKGNCELAESCSFCHLPHVKVGKLDKQQRRILATFPKSTLLAAILQNLRQRVEDQQLHGLHHATEIVLMLERELVLQPPQACADMELKRISKVLQGMTFAALVGLISSKHVRGALPMQIRTSLEQLRAYLAVCWVPVGLQYSAVQDMEKTWWVDISPQIDFSTSVLGMMSYHLKPCRGCWRIFRNSTASDPRGGGSMLQSFIIFLHFLSKQEGW